MINILTTERVRHSAILDDQGIRCLFHRIPGDSLNSFEETQLPHNGSRLSAVLLGCAGSCKIMTAWIWRSRRYADCWVVSFFLNLSPYRRHGIHPRPKVGGIFVFAANNCRLCQLAGLFVPIQERSGRSDRKSISRTHAASEHMKKNIFQRELAGEPVSVSDPEYNRILSVIMESYSSCTRSTVRRS